MFRFQFNSLTVHQMYFEKDSIKHGLESLEECNLKNVSYFKIVI